MRYILTFIVLLFCAKGFAQDGQLYNVGQLYIGPNTDVSMESDFENAATGIYNNDGNVIMKGDFENNGHAGFLNNSGTTHFEGIGTQNITGSKAVDYFNVELLNNSSPAPFHLSDTMNIYGNVSFKQGVIDNKNYPGAILFQPHSSYSDASDKSYVEGVVGKIGKEDFTFPVGKNGYFRPSATLFATSKGTNFGGEFIWKNSDNLYPHTAKEFEIHFIDDSEYWIIDTTSTIQDSLYIQLTWRKETTPDDIVEIAENGSSRYRVVVVRWDKNKSEWVNEGGTKDIGKQTVTSNKVDGFGVFTLALILRADKRHPVAHDDNSINNIQGDPVTLAILDNDDAGEGRSIVPATVSLIPSKGHCTDPACKEVDVLGEGTWSVDNNGNLTFTPILGFHDNPTPMDYTVENEGGLVSNKASVHIQYFKGRDIFIPNAFTPNNDGNNDVWKIFGSNIQSAHYMVFNQYGQKLFESNNWNVGWDGRYKGKLQPSGVYVYYAKIVFYDGTEITKKGSITLIR